jgi:hypothetical protein
MSRGSGAAGEGQCEGGRGKPQKVALHVPCITAFLEASHEDRGEERERLALRHAGVARIGAISRPRDRRGDFSRIPARGAMIYSGGWANVKLGPVSESVSLLAERFRREAKVT